MILLFSISANTLGDDELEAVLRSESMAKRTQSMAMDPNMSSEDVAKM
jgi:hypothetical protein